MKIIRILCVGFFVMITSIAHSQFIVISSDPEDGAVNVPLSGTISFTFNEPMDTTAKLGGDEVPISVAAMNLDSFGDGTISYSADLKTIFLQGGTHPAPGDYVWLIVGARSMTGQPLSKPYAVNYTTYPVNGQYEVSGTVTLQDGDPSKAIVILFDGPLFGDQDIKP